jgi:hypothetical protein
MVDAAINQLARIRRVGARLRALVHAPFQVAEEKLVCKAPAKWP